MYNGSGSPGSSWECKCLAGIRGMSELVARSSDPLASGQLFYSNLTSHGYYPVFISPKSK